MSTSAAPASDTRNRILDAAWEKVARDGADASLARIAQDAGVSRQAVYLHFGNRGGLLIALLRRMDERSGIATLLRDALALPDPAARLETGLAAWLDYVPRIVPVARDLLRLKATDAEARAAWDDRMGELKLWMRALVASLQADGALAPHWSVDEARDFLWALVGVPVWLDLVEECGWPAAQARRRMLWAAQALLAEGDAPETGAEL